MNLSDFTKRSWTILNRWALWILLMVASIYYFAGLPGIPFHPDESTYLFMSSDFNALFTHPATLFWQPSLESNVRQRYRELDAPIIRDLIGAGLMIGGYPSLSVDWDWSRSWNENVQAGALPDATQLLIGRASVAWLFPFSLALIYLIGKKLRSHRFGLLLAVLFASNALILLHTRRAMEESAMVFGVCFALWGILNAEKYPWIAAVGAAIAFNSKQSALALAPVALLAICWPYLHPASVKRILIHGSVFVAIFIGLTLLLNPFLLSNPVKALQAAILARENFITRQVETNQSLAPEQILFSPGERVLALVAQLYILPPAIEDVGNYTEDIAPSKIAYFQQAGTNLFRGFFWGSLFLGLTILGFILIGLKIIRNGLLKEKGNVLFLSAYILQFLVLIAALPIPYQRYWVPLIPLTCVLILVALFETARTGMRVIKPLLHNI